MDQLTCTALMPYPLLVGAVGMCAVSIPEVIFAACLGEELEQWRAFLIFSSSGKLGNCNEEAFITDIFVMRRLGRADGAWVADWSGGTAK